MRKSNLYKMYGIILRNYQKRIQNIYKMYHFHIQISYREVKWLTVLDLASAYWQILLTKRSRKYTIFLTAYRLYQFKVMPFGLVNVPATFQRLINDVLRDYLRKFCLVYLDDIIIYSKSLKDHK